MSNMKSPLPQCASMVRIQNILSGKWKITILWYIAEYKVQSNFESWNKTDLFHDMFIKKFHRK